MQNEIPPLRGEGEKHKIRRSCATQKVDNTSRLMGVNTAQGRAYLLCIVPNTDRDKQGNKDTKNTDAQGHSDTRVSAESRRVTTVSHVKRALHQTRRENETPTKTEKNGINAKFSRVGTFVRYTARDVLKSTVKIEIR